MSKKEKISRRGEDFEEKVQNLRHSFTHAKDLVGKFDSMYVQWLVKNLIATHDVDPSKLSEIFELRDYGPVSITISLEDTADDLHTTLSFQTHPILTTDYIDHLLTTSTVDSVTRWFLGNIKKIIKKYESGSLRKDILSIEDGKLLIDGHLLPVRRSVKNSLPLDSDDLDEDKQSSYIRTLLLFGAWLVHKKFVSAGRDKLINQEITADTFVKAINKENHDILGVLHTLFWSDYTIPFAFSKDKKLVILQVTDKGSLFRSLR